MTDLRHDGHGHVVPRVDGVKARCGGPGICAVCMREKASLESAPDFEVKPSIPAPSSDFETHPAGTARRIAQLEQEVAAQSRRLADMAVEMQKFMDESQQRR